MPKEFYTENDIEDLVKRGVLSLELNDDSVLTDLAYEKAHRLGMKLIRSKPENPPAAPVRPYISARATAQSAAVSTGVADSVPHATPKDLRGSIRAAVVAKLGSQVDPALLDGIIERVLKSTGLN